MSYVRDVTHVFLTISTVLKPRGVSFCHVFPSPIQGWNASRNHACWTYFWCCTDYLCDFHSRTIKSFMFVPKGAYMCPNYWLKIVLYSSFGGLLLGPHTYAHPHASTDTDIPPKATICDKLLWPQLQEMRLQRFQLPCLAWTWRTVTRPWPRLMWSLQCVQLHQGMVHLGVPCFGTSDLWYTHLWIHWVHFQKW